LKWVKLQENDDFEMEKAWRLLLLFDEESVEA